jgi:hypothetical protein
MAPLILKTVIASSGMKTDKGLVVGFLSWLPSWLVHFL